MISLINWLIDDTKHTVRAELRLANVALVQITRNLKDNSERQMPSKLKLRPTTNPDGTPIAVHAAPDNSAWRASHREAIIEPELPIIDPHHHLWDRHGQTYLLQEFMAEAQSGHNIVSSVFVECGAFYRKTGSEMMQRLGEVEFANGVAAIAASQLYGKTQVCAGIVGSADLTFGTEIGELLDAQIAAAGGRFKGIRLITKWDADEQLNNGRYLIPPKLMSDPDFRKGFAELGPRNLSFDTMIYHHQIPEVIDLARSFPDTTIILNHIGGLIAKTRTYLAKEKEATDTWRASMHELAKYPNVYVKLGGLGMSYLGFGFEKLAKPADSTQLAAAWGPLFDDCIEAFGAQRCMFESNFPPDRASVDYHVIWNAFKRVAAKYSAADKQALFFGTAAKAYLLKLD